MKHYLLFVLLALVSFPAISQKQDVNLLKKNLALATSDSARVNRLFALSMVYIFYYPDSVEKFAKEGLQLAQKINYPVGQAQCMMNLCLTLNSSGNYTEALSYGLQAHRLVTELKDTFLLTWSNIQIMTCYISLEDYDQALVYGNAAKRLFRFAHPDLNQISVGLGVLGSVHEMKNQLDSALYYEQKAFLFDTSWTGLFVNIGNTYFKKGRTDLALGYYKRGLAVAAKEQNLLGFVEIYTDISKVFERTGPVDSSIYFANK